MSPRNVAYLAVIGLLVTALMTAPVAAQDTDPDQESDDEDDETVIELGPIDDLVEEFEEFKRSWTDKVAEAIQTTLFRPFLVLLKTLVTSVASVLTYTPAVYPNPAVEEIHRETLLVAYSLSGLGFAVAGLLYLTGPLLGISYSQVNQILPRLIVALAFATVSLPLLQYAVDFTNAMTTAFEPDAASSSIREIAGVSAPVVLAWVINSSLLLAVVALFILRIVYILFVAAVSPLLAFAWALPMTKRYADTFIAGFWAALAMAPLDMLVLKFSFVLFQSTGTGPLQDVSNWMFGVASFTLLLWVPNQLYGASQAGVGQANSLARNVKQRVGRYRSKKRREQFRERQLRAMRQEGRDRRRASSYIWGDDDD